LEVNGELRMVNGQVECHFAIHHFTIHPSKGDRAHPGQGKMARNDQANDTFEITSFLYGGNADYIEAALCRLARRPELGRRGVAGLLRRPEGRRRRCRQERAGRVLAGQKLAAAGQWRTGLGARRQLGPGRKGHRQEAEGQGRRRGQPALSPADDAARDARFECAPS
jgi:hypothetical protein